MRSLLILFVLAFGILNVDAQTDTTQQVPQTGNQDTRAPIILHGDTIYYLYGGLGVYTVEDRASKHQETILSLFSPSFSRDSFGIRYATPFWRVYYGQEDILVITQGEANQLSVPDSVAASIYLVEIREALAAAAPSEVRRNLVWNIVNVVIVILVFVIVVWSLSKMYKWALRKLKERSGRYFKGVRVKNYDLITPEAQLKLIALAMNFMKWFFILLLLSIAFPFIFSLIPSTEHIAKTLFGYVLNPLRNIGLAALNFIPNLIMIAIVVIITRYIIQAMRYLSREVETGRLEMHGFYADWAMPTFNLFRIFVYAFAFIVVFPYLPGSNSPAFQGVSVFLGLLISLGSTTAVSNIIASLVITYMRAFKKGDRVKIGETVGDVVEKTMLVTRVRTIKNEDITIPNAAILNGHTTNYSSSAQELGLILNTTVTIGYDVPWRKVHEMLIKAAMETEHIEKDPKPFVLQTSLDDYYVSYQINAYTQQASFAARIYSELHSRIQDVFNEAGVEIMSPEYQVERHNEDSTIPREYQKRPDP